MFLLWPGFSSWPHNRSCRRFNPLYWGVFIVTFLLCEPTELIGTSFNPLYWGVFIVTVHRFKNDFGTLLSFNPLYWGVFIVTELRALGFDVVVIEFQSSLLRCFYCDVIPNFVNMVGFLLVSILFIEVFLLWRILRPRTGWRSWSWFQSSLLRCFYCDSGRRRHWYTWLSTPFSEHLIEFSII